MAPAKKTGSSARAPRRTAKKKLFHKIKDVCELTSTEPYVLRYWEQEFPFLAPEKNKAGHRIYTDEDIELVRRIKRLLYEDGYTTAGARRQLEKEREEGFVPEAEAPAEASAEGSASAEETAELRAELERLRTQVGELEADRERLRESLRGLRESAVALRELLQPPAKPASKGGKKTTAGRKKTKTGKAGAEAKGKSRRR